MSLFGGFGGGVYRPLKDIIEDPLGLKELEKTKKQVKMLFTDVETEGKKQGYERASKEYENAFRRVEREFRETKRILDDDIATNDQKTEQLLARLENLEKKREKLEKDVKQKTKQVSDAFNIPVGKLTQSMVSGSLFVGGPSVDILGMICSLKERKLQNAEQEGYEEARALYLNKIEKLRNRLEELKKQGNKKIKELVQMSESILQDISDEELKIAELKILLSQ